MTYETVAQGGGYDFQVYSASPIKWKVIKRSKKTGAIVTRYNDMFNSRDGAVRFANEKAKVGLL
jgi:hypothetical protein